MNSEAPSDGPGGAELSMAGWFVVQKRLDTSSLVKKSLKFSIENLNMRNPKLSTIQPESTKLETKTRSLALTATQHPALNDHT
jgi:hypothetical protein